MPMTLVVAWFGGAVGFMVLMLSVEWGAAYNELLMGRLCTRGRL
jgi:hypothetical protein